MATERELRTHQERMLYLILKAQTLLEAGVTDILSDYLLDSFEDAQSGMNNDEVDAIRARVARSCKNHIKNKN